MLLWQCVETALIKKGPHPVVEAGGADGEELEEATQLRRGDVHYPALDQTLVCIFHDPQETHKQVTAGLGRQLAAAST